jgi:hypothetical protein
MTIDPTTAMYATDGRRHYDVIRFTAKSVVLRPRRPDYATKGVRDERFDTGVYGSGVMRYPTVSDLDAPEIRFYKGKDGEWRGLRFLDAEPVHLVDNRI